MASVNPGRIITCPECGETRKTLESLRQHRRWHRKMQAAALQSQPVSQPTAQLQQDPHLNQHNTIGPGVVVSSAAFGFQPLQEPHPPLLLCSAACGLVPTAAVSSTTTALCQSLQKVTLSSTATQTSGEEICPSASDVHSDIFHGAGTLSYSTRRVKLPAGETALSSSTQPSGQISDRSSLVQIRTQASVSHSMSSRIKTSPLVDRSRGTLLPPPSAETSSVVGRNRGTTSSSPFPDDALSFTGCVYNHRPHPGRPGRTCSGVSGRTFIQLS